MISKQNKRQGPVFIIGSGDVGCRVAKQYLNQGTEVVTLSRSSTSCEGLVTTHLQADLDDISTLPTLARHPALPNSAFIYLAPPPQTGTQDSRMTNFLHALNEQPPKQIVYISTSGVYGDCNGEWVDETHPTNPTTDRSKRRLSAEHQLRSWGERHQCPITILRVGGIYGPNRLPLARLEKGIAILNRELAPFSNRIHADDLANICIIAAEQPTDFAIYNVSDGHPSTMSDYFISVAEATGLPLPRELDWTEAEQQLSPEMLSYLRENKRLDNRKLLRELAITLKYPTLQDGLATCKFHKPK